MNSLDEKNKNTAARYFGPKVKVPNILFLECKTQTSLYTVNPYNTLDRSGTTDKSDRLHAPLPCDVFEYEIPQLLRHKL